MWDRSTRIALKDLIAVTGANVDRQTLDKQFQQLMKERGETTVGAQRVFLGSRDRTAALRLMDTDGRERVRIMVDASNTPRMEFVDEGGKVVY